MDYLTNSEHRPPAGRHRAALPRYLDIAWTEELTGHRRAVAELPASVRAALHRQDETYPTEPRPLPGPADPMPLPPPWRLR